MVGALTIADNNFPTSGRHADRRCADSRPVYDFLMGTTTLKERLTLAMKGPPVVRVGELARACGVKSPSVSGWLSGATKKLEGANLLNAARKLNVNPEWLATGRGPMRLNASGGEVGRKSHHDDSLTDLGNPSQPLTLDPDTLYEALTLLLHDEHQAGPYSPRAQAARLADLYARVAADGGRLTKQHNDDFVEEVLLRQERSEGGTGSRQRGKPRA
jgi:transcriptional regulator with XRE-family HTH domain